MGGMEASRRASAQRNRSPSGAHTTASVDQGLENVIRGIRAVESQLRPQHCPLLLENTAGQGTCLGWKIEQLGYLLKQLSSPMVQICWDTCHALAAGYDFRTPNGLREMVAELQRCKVLEAIRAVHVNDSMKDCGSRVDRHEHIGLDISVTGAGSYFWNRPSFEIYQCIWRLKREWMRMARTGISAT